MSRARTHDSDDRPGAPPLTDCPPVSRTWPPAGQRRQPKDMEVGRHGVNGYSPQQLDAIESKVLDACIALKAQGLYPGSLRLAKAVPGHHKNTLLDARARLIARGALSLDVRHGTEDKARPRRHRRAPIDPDDHVAVFKAAWKRIMRIPRHPGDDPHATPAEQTTVDQE